MNAPGQGTSPGVINGQDPDGPSGAPIRADTRCNFTTLDPQDPIPRDGGVGQEEKLPAGLEIKPAFMRLEPEGVGMLPHPTFLTKTRKKENNRCPSPLRGSTSPQLVCCHRLTKIQFGARLGFYNFT